MTKGKSKQGKPGARTTATPGDVKVPGFRPLALSMPFRRPRRLTDVDCWHLHIPFAFAVVEILRPRRVVELGTHKGDSYCALCQAVDELGLETACYAVDNWQGDEQAGYYGAEVLEELKAYHDPLYGRFSRLVQTFFDEALGQFDDGTIDLLHIDGCHIYEAVSHDFHAWLPKVSKRGVVLLHDTNVREKGFGVWKLWEEIRSRFPHFEFLFGNGLGVLAPGERPDPAVMAFFQECRENGPAMSSFFSTLGENITLIQENSKAKTELDRYSKATKGLMRALEEKDKQLSQIGEESEERAGRIRGLQNEMAGAEEKIRAFCDNLAAKEDQLRQADVWLREYQAALERLQVEKDEQLTAKEEQLRQADVWLREYQAALERLQVEKDEQLAAKDDQLCHADIWLRESQSNQERLQEELARYQIRAEMAEQTLRRIYNFWAWRWFIRHYRTVKRLFSSVQAPADFLQASQYEETTVAEPFRASEVRVLRSPEDNRQKVVHAIANFMTGGSSRLVADLYERLGHRYDQEVLTSFIPDPPAYRGIPVHDFSRLEKPGDVTAFLRDRNAALVHLHYWGECDERWYRLVLEGLRGLPVKVIENVNTPVAPLLDDRIDRYVYVSRYALEFTPPDREKSLVIHPGSDLNLFDRDGAPVPDDVVGTVYRLEPDKLREDAIGVFIDVVKQRPATRVLVIGGGTFLEPWRSAVAEAGLFKSFQFTDYVSYDTLPEWYRKMSVFVAPVWKESFGQVSPFAMSMGIPVAGYRVGALEEILGDGRCLGRDREALSKIVVGLLDDREERLRIGEKNRERAHQLFSLETMVDKYSRLYEEILRDHEKEK